MEVLIAAFPEYELDDSIRARRPEFNWESKDITISNVRTRVCEKLGIAIEEFDKKNEKWDTNRKLLLWIEQEDMNLWKLRASYGDNKWFNSYIDVLIAAFPDYELESVLLERKNEHVYDWKSRAETVNNVRIAIIEFLWLSEDIPKDSSDQWTKNQGLLKNINSSTFKQLWINSSYQKNEWFNSYVDVLIAAFPEYKLQDVIQYDNTWWVFSWTTREETIANVRLAILQNLWIKKVSDEWDGEYQIRREQLLSIKFDDFVRLWIWNSVIKNNWFNSHLDLLIEAFPEHNIFEELSKKRVDRVFRWRNEVEITRNVRNTVIDKLKLPNESPKKWGGDWDNSRTRLSAISQKDFSEWWLRRSYDNDFFTSFLDIIIASFPEYELQEIIKKRKKEFQWGSKEITIVNAKNVISDRLNIPTIIPETNSTEWHVIRNSLLAIKASNLNDWWIWGACRQNNWFNSHLDVLMTVFPEYDLSDLEDRKSEKVFKWRSEKETIDNVRIVLSSKFWISDLAPKNSSVEWTNSKNKLISIKRVDFEDNWLAASYVWNKWFNSYLDILPFAFPAYDLDSDLDKRRSIFTWKTEREKIVNLCLNDIVLYWLRWAFQWNNWFSSYIQLLISTFPEYELKWDLREKWWNNRWTSKELTINNVRSNIIDTFQLLEDWAEKWSEWWLANREILLNISWNDFIRMWIQWSISWNRWYNSYIQILEDAFPEYDLKNDIEVKFVWNFRWRSKEETINNVRSVLLLHHPSLAEEPSKWTLEWYKMINLIIQITQSDINSMWIAKCYVQNKWYPSFKDVLFDIFEEKIWIEMWMLSELWRFAFLSAIENDWINQISEHEKGIIASYLLWNEKEMLELKTRLKSVSVTSIRSLSRDEQLTEAWAIFCDNLFVMKLSCPVSLETLWKSNNGLLLIRTKFNTPNKSANLQGIRDANQKKIDWVTHKKHGFASHLLLWVDALDDQIALQNTIEALPGHERKIMEEFLIGNRDITDNEVQSAIEMMKDNI